MQCQIPGTTTLCSTVKCVTRSAAGRYSSAKHLASTMEFVNDGGTQWLCPS